MLDKTQSWFSFRGKVQFIPLNQKGYNNKSKEYKTIDILINPLKVSKICSKIFKDLKEITTLIGKHNRINSDVNILFNHINVDKLWEKYVFL